MFSHGSNLDPLIIQRSFSNYLQFVSKKELFNIPVIGYILKSMGQIPIDRNNLDAAIDSLNKTSDLIQKNHSSVCIAPEGTRRRSNSIGPDQIQPFKKGNFVLKNTELICNKGPFHLAKACNVDIIPAIIIGANRLFPPGQPIPYPGE